MGRFQVLGIDIELSSLGLLSASSDFLELHDRLEGCLHVLVVSLLFSSEEDWDTFQKQQSIHINILWQTIERRQKTEFSKDIQE